AIRAVDGGRRDVLLVIKADAYGHGAVEIAEAAEREGGAHPGAATLHGRIQLRQSGCRLPIVVLSPLLTSEIQEAIDHDLSPTAADVDFAGAAAARARRAGA